MDLSIIGFVLLIVCLLGFYLAYLYGRKTLLFRWSEYLAIIFLPIASIIFLALYIDLKILNLYIISALAGFFLEYIIGLTYYKTLNRRLYKYKRFSIGGHTSLLSIPLWGIAGVLFWLFGKMIGI